MHALKSYLCGYPPSHPPCHPQLEALNCSPPPAWCRPTPHGHIPDCLPPSFTGCHRVATACAAAPQCVISETFFDSSLDQNCVLRKPASPSQGQVQKAKGFLAKHSLDPEERWNAKGKSLSLVFQVSKGGHKDFYHHFDWEFHVGLIVFQNSYH